ncbi:hypothetical protein PF011_g9424 [Phytophthora fragariae]|uniref:ABC-transporter N-terminal domain-containing protein n=1 Tax=Phytophthora fragariae TaxID=53985 RepID=A0A6A3L006_9STRA|nr:hypothetical protein PF011_g9424 [Phytophthora fragariae]KAE9339092.1 hypothetical protein PF008_g11744 [Phytophthora fragariae]
MAHGASALHEHVASRMQASLGRKLPQVEVRFKDVSVSANIVVKDETQLEAELPTIANVVKQSARSIGAKRHVVKKNTLRSVSGVFKPGSMTLVLGQPAGLWKNGLRLSDCQDCQSQLLIARRSQSAITILKLSPSRCWGYHS